MKKVILFIFLLSSVVFSQTSVGDLKTSFLDTLFLRTEIKIESEEAISIKQMDVNDLSSEKLKGISITVVPLLSSETNTEEFLSVGIYVIRNYFTVIVEYNRKAIYRAKEEFKEIDAPTWRRMIGGGHGSDKKYIMNVVNDLLDNFVSDFKEQNKL